MIRDTYHLVDNQKTIDNFLTIFKTPADVTSTNLQKVFSRTVKKEEDTIIGVGPPPYYTSDEFILKNGILPNCTKDTKTTFGLYIFNLLCIVDAFDDVIPYINEAMTENNVKKLYQQISNLIIQSRITNEQFAKFIDNFIFLGYKATLFSPGFSFEFVKNNPKIESKKKELVAEYKRKVEAGANPVSTFVNVVEAPLLALAKEILKDDPDWPYYERGGKPDINVILKESVICMGPVYDPVTGRFEIIESSLSSGVPKEKIDTFANILVASSYSRAVSTQDGGAKTKLIFSAMQSVKLAEDGKRGTDCQCGICVKKTITEYNCKDNIYRYIKENGKLVRLTHDNIKSYIGKTVAMRSPLFCNSKDYCNICVGDYYYELGVTNIGNTATKISSRLMNMALKQMHDSTVKVTVINPFDYITKL